MTSLGYFLNILPQIFFPKQPKYLVILGLFKNSTSRIKTALDTFGQFVYSIFQYLVTLDQRLEKHSEGQL